MGEVQAVIGPLVATHPEAAWLLSLLQALDDGSLDVRIDRLSVLLRPKPPDKPVEGFL